MLVAMSTPGGFVSSRKSSLSSRGGTLFPSPSKTSAGASSMFWGNILPASEATGSTSSETRELASSPADFGTLWTISGRKGSSNSVYGSLRSESSLGPSRPIRTSYPASTLYSEAPLSPLHELETMDSSVGDPRIFVRGVEDAPPSETRTFYFVDSPYGTLHEPSALSSFNSSAMDEGFGERRNSDHQGVRSVVKVGGNFRGETDGGQENNWTTGLDAAFRKLVDFSPSRAAESRKSFPNSMVRGHALALRGLKERRDSNLDFARRQTRGPGVFEGTLRSQRSNAYGFSPQMMPSLTIGHADWNLEGDRFGSGPGASEGTPQCVILPAALDSSHTQSGPSEVSIQTLTSRSDSREENYLPTEGSFSFFPSLAYSKGASRAEGGAQEQKEHSEGFLPKTQNCSPLPHHLWTYQTMTDMRHKTTLPARERSSPCLAMRRGTSSSTLFRLSGRGGMSFESFSHALPPCTAVGASAAAWRRERDQAARTLLRLQALRRKHRAEQVARVESARRSQRQLRVPPLALGSLAPDTGGGGSVVSDNFARRSSSSRLLVSGPPVAQRTSRSVADAKDAFAAGATAVGPLSQLSKLDTVSGLSAGRKTSLCGSEASGGRILSGRSIVLSDRQSPRPGDWEGEDAHVNTGFMSAAGLNSGDLETQSLSEIPDGAAALRSPTLGQNVTPFTRLLTLKMIRQGHKTHAGGNKRLTPRDPRSGSEGGLGTLGTLPSSSIRSPADDSTGGLQSLVSFTPSSTGGVGTPLPETLRAMSTCTGHRSRRRSCSAAPPTRLETLFQSSCDESWNGITDPFNPASRRSRSSVPSGSRVWGAGGGGDAAVWLGGDREVESDRIKGKGKPAQKRQDSATKNKGLSNYLGEGVSPLLAAVVKEVERDHSESLTARKARERKILATPSRSPFREEDEEGEEGGLPGTGGGSTGFETYGEFGESRLVEIKTGRTSDIDSLKRLDVSRRFFLAALLFLKENSQTFPVWREMTRCRRQLRELVVERRRNSEKERRKKRVVRKQPTRSRKAASSKPKSEHCATNADVSGSGFPNSRSPRCKVPITESRMSVLSGAASVSPSPWLDRDREQSRNEDDAWRNRDREAKTSSRGRSCPQSAPESADVEPGSSYQVASDDVRSVSASSPAGSCPVVTREAIADVRKGETSRVLRSPADLERSQVVSGSSALPRHKADSAAFQTRDEQSYFPTHSVKSGGPFASKAGVSDGNQGNEVSGGFSAVKDRGKQQDGVVAEVVPGNADSVSSVGCLSRHTTDSRSRHQGPEGMTGLGVSREEGSAGRNVAASGYLGGDSSNASTSSESESDSGWDARELVFHTDDEVERARLRMQILSRDSFEDLGGEGGSGRPRPRRKENLEGDDGQNSFWEENEGKLPQKSRTFSALLRREGSFVGLARVGQGTGARCGDGSGNQQATGQQTKPGIDLDGGVPTAEGVFAQLKLVAAKSRSIPSLRACLINGDSWAERPLFPLLSSLLKASRSVSPPSVVVPVVAAAYALILSSLFVARLHCCRVLVECCLLARKVLGPTDLLGHEDCVEACRALRYDFARLDRLRVRQASIVLGDARRAFISVLAALYPFDFIGHPDTLLSLQRDEDCHRSRHSESNATSCSDVLDDSGSSDGGLAYSTRAALGTGQVEGTVENKGSLGWWQEEDEQLGELQLQADRLNQRLEGLLSQEWEIREAAQEVMAELASLDQLEHEVLGDAERATSLTKATKGSGSIELTGSGKGDKEMVEEVSTGEAPARQSDAEARAESLAHIDMQRIDVEEKFIQLYEASKRVGEEIVRLQQQREALLGVQKRAQQERRLTMQESQKVQEHLDKLCEDRGSRGSRVLHRGMSRAMKQRSGQFEGRGRSPARTKTVGSRPHRGVSWRAEGELRCLVEMTQRVLQTVQTQAGAGDSYEEEASVSNRPPLLDEAERAFIDRLQTDCDFRAFFLSDLPGSSDASSSSGSRQASLERELGCSTQDGQLIESGTSLEMRMSADSDQGSTSLYAGAMSCGKASSISSMPAELVPEAPDPQAVRGLFKLIEEPLLAIRTTSTQVGAGGLAAGLSAVSVASWNLLDRLVSVHDQAGDAQFRF